MTTASERVTPLSTHSGVFEVMGSRGDVYAVDRNCTCPGFRYRRHCKHIDMVKEYQVAHQSRLESDLQRKIEELYR
jgi:hypothetical protein